MPAVATAGATNSALAANRSRPPDALRRNEAPTASATARSVETVSPVASSVSRKPQGLDALEPVEPEVGGLKVDDPELARRVEVAVDRELAYRTEILGDVEAVAADQQVAPAHAAQDVVAARARQGIVGRVADQEVGRIGAQEASAGGPPHRRVLEAAAEKERPRPPVDHRVRLVRRIGGQKQGHVVERHVAPAQALRRRLTSVASSIVTSVALVWTPVTGS